MADEQSQQDDTLTKVARTVGTAVGTVAGLASKITGGNTAESRPSGGRQPRNAAAASAMQRAQQKKKDKRLKHKRKLHRRTRG